MENKYYTPTIEEFHVGFEYERMNGDKWEEAELTERDMHASHSNDGEENEFEEIAIGIRDVRVKYLDKEDIESLGWVYREDRGLEENYGGLYIINDPVFSKANIELKYWPINNRVNIYRINGTIFEGKINNKSELKQLLAWLKV